MRIRRAVLATVGIAAAICCSVSLRAQDGDSGGQREPLTIWIVRPITAADRAVRQTQKDLEEIKQYRESTSGGFGKPASETGQTAGSYGKPTSEEGRPASEAGQTAGSYGQTAGSLPSNVPSQTAGSYGQTAGSFGQSASSYTGAPATLPAAKTVSQDDKQSRLAELVRSFRGSSDQPIHVVEVPGLELQERLRTAEGKEAFPDVLAADTMPTWWQSVMFQMTVRRLADLPALQVVADEEPPEKRTSSARPYAYIYGLVQAPHPEAAREFLEWWLTGLRLQRFAASPKRATQLRAESLAREAVSTVLAGGTIDSMADPTMPRFNSPLTRANLLGFPESETPTELKTDVAVTYAQANDRFAAIQLHVVCVSRLIYGEFFPLVLLRTDTHGGWRVLQITFGISPRDAGLVQRMIDPYARKNVDVRVAAPVLASPPDGDARPVESGLRLAWDAEKEDGLLLVEWQLGKEPHLIASSIMMVPNQEGRAHTETTAPFANVSGMVRWRVWSLGHGGLVQMSEWRTVQMR